MWVLFCRFLFFLLFWYRYKFVFMKTVNTSFMLCFCVLRMYIRQCQWQCVWGCVVLCCTVLCWGCVVFCWVEVMLRLGWSCIVLCGFILFYFALGHYYCVLLCLCVVFEARTQSSFTSKTRDGSKTHGTFDRQTFTRSRTGTKFKYFLP